MSDYYQRDMSSLLPEVRLAESNEQLRAEIAKLKAELEEARGIMRDFMSCMCADDEGGVMTEIIVPTGTLRQARAFLDKAGK